MGAHCARVNGLAFANVGELLMLSSAEQTQIQSLLDGASPDERMCLRAEAEDTLGYVNRLMGRTRLSPEDNKRAQVAIEILTRLDANERGGGWWYRTKRRIQLTQMYLGV